LEEASASSRKSRSLPYLRTEPPSLSSLQRLTLSPSQLLQQIEQSTVILLSICEQYITTFSLWLSPSATKFELRVLTNNLSSLVSQLETVVTILRMYSYQYPSLTKKILLCLPASDRDILVHSVLTHCKTLWQFLRRPSSPVVRYNTARILTTIDTFLLDYLSHSLPDPTIYTQFKQPPSPAKPSIIKQITSFEITSDPYYSSLQCNYYYPISPDPLDKMTTSNSAPMSIDTESGNQPPSPNSLTSKSKPPITVEDSMEVIAELIQEIQNADAQDISSQASVGRLPPTPVKSKRASLRVSLAKRTRESSSSSDFLPHLKKNFHALLSTGQTSILPIRNDSKVGYIKSTSQVNELTSVGAKTFLKASKPNSHCISGDYHLLTSMSFEELTSNTKVLDWLHAYGYYLVLSDCQSSDMIKIGFIARVRPFTWREDLRDAIKDSPEWRENPFQFRFFFGSISSNKKGEMAPVLMVEVERDNISLGLDFFCNMFDGDNPLSPCGLPYIFFLLYQNTLTDAERVSIIYDIKHHIGQYQLIRLYGLKNLDTLVTLKQNVKIKLRKLLLNIRPNQSTSSLFIQVEKESDPTSILCAFESVHYDLVMTNIPNISHYIQQCIMEEDLPRVFVNSDYSILVPQ
jgi:hypothetical protein